MVACLRFSGLNILQNCLFIFVLCACFCWVKLASLYPVTLDKTRDTKDDSETSICANMLNYMMSSPATVRSFIRIGKWTGVFRYYSNKRANKILRGGQTATCFRPRISLTGSDLSSAHSRFLFWGVMRGFCGGIGYTCQLKKLGEGEHGDFRDSVWDMWGDRS